MSATSTLRARASSPFSTFVGSGVVTTLLYFAIYNLTRIAVAPVAANVVAWCVCLAAGFLLNSRITFRDRRGRWPTQLAGFLAVYVSSAVVTTLALNAFVETYGPDKALENLLLVAVQVVLVLVRYLLLSTWVFRREPREDVPAGRAGAVTDQLPRLSPWDADGLLAGLLATFGALVAAVTIARRGVGEFYQSTYEPAVRFACGQGFADYSGTDRAVEAFLTVREGGFGCSAAPDGGTVPLAFDQAAARYLQLTVGLVWRVVGVSWESLLPLYALLAAGTGAALYGLARLVLPKAAAAPLAALLLLSPLHLFMLPQLRDYAKAPFLLGAFLTTALLVRHRRRLRTSLLLSAATGLLVGVGFGFRADVMLVIPLFLVTVVVFWPGGPHRDLGTRALAAAVFLAAFALLSAPVRAGLPEGGNSAHWAVLGLGTSFTQTLGLEQDLYDLGYVYNDTYATSLVDAHAYRVEGFRGPVVLSSPKAEEYGMRLLRDTAATFPADLLARGYAATLHVTALPIESASRAVAESSRVAGIAAAPVGVLAAQRWLAPAVVVLALLVGAARQLRLALLAAFAVMYLGALSALQYDARHVFHLEGISLVAGTFLLLQLVRVVQARRAGRTSQHLTKRAPAVLARRLWPVGAMAGALLVATVGLLVPARAVQAAQVDALLGQLQALPRDPVALTPRPVDGSTTLLALPDRTISGAPVFVGSSLVRSSYLVARVRPARCGVPVALLTWRYRSTTAYTDFSRTVQVPRPTDPEGAVDVYFLGLSSDSFVLAGVELPTAVASCLESVSVVRNTDSLPLLVNASLPQDWGRATPFQTFPFEQRKSATPPTPRLISSAAGLAPAGPAGVRLPLTTPAFAAPGLRVEEDGWTFRGRPETGSAYVAVSAEQPCSAQGAITVSGSLSTGRAALGVQQQGQWVGVVTLAEPGRFIAVLHTPVIGTCSLVLAHAGSSGDKLAVRVTDAFSRAPRTSPAP